MEKYVNSLVKQLQVIQFNLVLFFYYFRLKIFNHTASISKQPRVNQIV
jgi:hypothetical protein